MPKKIIFKGTEINERGLVIGNHDEVHLIVNGDFFLEGLVYCPRHFIELSCRGNGTLLLHGTCKGIVLRNVVGHCMINMEDVKIQSFSSQKLGGNCIVKMQRPKHVLEKNILDNAKLYFDGENQSLTHNSQFINFTLNKSPLSAQSLADLPT